MRKIKEQTRRKEKGRKNLRTAGFFFVCMLAAFLAPGCKNSEMFHDVKTKPKPWTHLNFYNNPDDFRFAIVSDRCGGCRKGVFPKAVEKLNLLKPEFVICVGDLIQGYTKEPKKLMDEWNEFNAFVDKFQMPFFYVSGNHDISNKEMAVLWEKLFGRSYYCFIYKNVLFMCLNTQETPEYVYRSPNRHLSDKQIAWAKKTLKKHPDVRWTCIFMHQPLWAYDKDTGFKEIEKALKGKDYTVFAGHFHQYTKYTRNGKKYIILATTGGGSNLRGPSFGEFDEAVWVAMTDKGPAIANLLIDGILPENVMTEKKLLEKKRNAAFLNTVKFTLDEDRSFEGKLFFSLSLKNNFKHKLKYDLTWKTPRSLWKTIPEKSEGFIEPEKEKTLHFESLAGGKINIPAVCDARFYVENELDIKTELSTKRLIARVKQPSAEAVFTAEKPKIDGKLDDAIWIKAQKLTPFFTMHGESASAETFAYLTYDKDNLYIAFKCSEPNVKGIRNKVNKHDGPVWKDDSVEIFIDANKDKKSYYQIVVNPSAVIYDSFINNRVHKKNYEIDPEARAMVNNDSWTLEIAIPWKNLNIAPPSKGQKMGLLLVRTRTQKEGIMQCPAMFGGNHQPEIFGNLKFK